MEILSLVVSDNAIPCSLSLFPTGTHCFRCWLCCLRSVSRPHRAQSASLQPALMSTLRTLCTSRSRSVSLSSARTPNSTTWYPISIHVMFSCISVHLCVSTSQALQSISCLFATFLLQLQQPLLVEAIRAMTEL